MILLLHDVCDVLMEAAKMCKYCKQEVRPARLSGTGNRCYLAYVCRALACPFCPTVPSALPACPSPFCGIIRHPHSRQHVRIPGILLRSS